MLPDFLNPFPFEQLAQDLERIGAVSSSPDAEIGCPQLRVLLGILRHAVRSPSFQSSLRIQRLKRPPERLPQDRIEVASTDQNKMLHRYQLSTTETRAETLDSGVFLDRIANPARVRVK